ncbi:MFS transporter [Actinoallomurus iriomotensis]|uniref:MFS transporter n=1 Tax=Actinoallomurus iriomotensis TaxID=478107 RepID=A0A9W6RUE3_9ACTN|nr:MFS transporter [Actinoallomurus iriomotensis]GLY81903.1 MFS transporter [Actinoallomurus iriomotensis]
MAIAERATERRRGRAAGLVRYLVAAALVRGADSGASVGLVLLAVDPGTGLGDGAPAAGGVLAAALSAPHLLGPWTARRLERARDARRLLAGAYLLYAAALAAGAVALGRLPLAPAVGAVAVAGCCGPLLTGGLSSRLPAIVGGRADGRPQGWDALTYSIGGTAGPAVVAGLAALSGPLSAVFGLAGAAAAGAVLTLTLPRGPASGRTRVPDGAYGMRAGLRVLTAHAGLRRVTIMTLLSALALGALPVIAALFGPHLSDRPGAGATLTVALGLGNLAGALLVTVFPLRADPDALARRLFTLLAVATALCAAAPAYGFALAGFAFIGVGIATSFTATLAARTRYAPPSAHAQVFVTSAGLKIAVSSAGAALTGIAAGLGGRVLLLLAAAVTASAVLVALADRVFTERAS